MIYKKGNYLKAESGSITWAVPVDLIYKVDMDYMGVRITGDFLWIRGVLHYEGEMIPAFDLQGLLKQKATESKGYLICRIGGELLAFVASEFKEVFHISQEEFDMAVGISTGPFVTIERDGTCINIIQEDVMKRVEQ